MYAFFQNKSYVRRAKAFQKPSCLSSNRAHTPKSKRDRVRDLNYPRRKGTRSRTGTARTGTALLRLSPFSIPQR